MNSGAHCSDFLLAGHGVVFVFLFFFFAIANSCSTCISDRTWVNRLYITIMKKILFSLRSVLIVYEICSRPGSSH